jgi:hypothetical protein
MLWNDILHVDLVKKTPTESYTANQLQRSKATVKAYHVN